MSYDNLIPKETFKLESGTGDWAATDNCSIRTKTQFSPFSKKFSTPADIESSLKVTSLASGDMTVTVGKYACTPESVYRAFAFVAAEAGGTPRAIECGISFYDLLGNQLATQGGRYAGVDPGFWAGIVAYKKAPVIPSGTVTVEMYVTIKDTAAAGEVFYIARPSILEYFNFNTNFLTRMTGYLPEYLVLANRQGPQNANELYRPLERFLQMATYRLNKVETDVYDFRHVSANDSSGGLEILSRLSNPYKANASWLSWLGNMTGVTIVPVGVGFTPWLAFLGVEPDPIDTWTEWEEEIQAGGVPGFPDTTWTAIETFAQDFFSLVAFYRLQIASGFNGVMGAQRLSYKAFMRALLNTSNPLAYVAIKSHYRTNPFRMLGVVRIGEDLDPEGDTIKDSLQAAAPAGMLVEVEHGLRHTALRAYSATDFFNHLNSDPLALGLPETFENVSEIPTLAVEDEMATGRNLIISDMTAVSDEEMGGGVYQGKWFDGYALNSGGVEATSITDASLNINGNDDLEVRVLVSDLQAPASGQRTFISSPTQWFFSINSSGQPVFEWYSGTVLQTVTSTIPLPTLKSPRPVWYRVQFDKSTGVVTFAYTYDPFSGWTVHEAIDGTDDLGIDSDASAVIQLLDKTTATGTVTTAICAIHRAMVYNGIAAGQSLVLDTNFIETNDEVHTGTLSFSESAQNLGITISAAVDSDPDITVNRWVALNYTDTPYLHFGHSPLSDHAGAADLGDTLVASGLASDTYDWTVTYLDDTTDTGTTGAGVTSVTFKADDYGGKAIKSVLIEQNGTSDDKALLEMSESPMPFGAGSLTHVDQLDSNVTWTLTQAFETGEYYEYSSPVDRNIIKFSDGVGTVFRYLFGPTGVLATKGFDYLTPLSAAIIYRRYWDTTGTMNLINAFDGTSGWRLRINGDLVEAYIDNGDGDTTTLTWDEQAAGRIGAWNCIILRRDQINNTWDLFVNGAEEDSADDIQFSSGAWPSTHQLLTVGSSGDQKDFEFTLIAIWDRTLTDNEITFLTEDSAID